MKAEFNRLDETTRAWVLKVAKLNNVTPEDVLAYLDALSNSRRVIHHLKLV